MPPNADPSCHQCHPLRHDAITRTGSAKLGKSCILLYNHHHLNSPVLWSTNVSVHQCSVCQCLGSSAPHHKRPPLFDHSCFRSPALHMCYTITEGVRFGCGHYAPLCILGLSEWCMDKQCVTSETHPRDCQQCSGNCQVVRTSGEERIRFRMNGWCSSCRYMLQQRTPAPLGSSPDNPATPSQPQPSL